jgi:anti-sigma B factor antagonist
MAAFRVDAGSDGVLYLTGELDLAAEQAFDTLTDERLDGQGEVTLDLSELTFVDSTGVRAFIRLARQVSPRRLVLRDPVPAVATVFEIVGLDCVLGIRVERD